MDSASIAGLNMKMPFPLLDDEMEKTFMTLIILTVRCCYHYGWYLSCLLPWMPLVIGNDGMALKFA